MIWDAPFDPPPQDRLNCADEHGSDGSARETANESNHRDGTQVHAALLLRAGSLIRLSGCRGRLRMREMPRERPGGSAPLRCVRRADGRSAEMALCSDHAERDHERDERPGDPAGDRGDDDRAVEDVHLAIHPLENFQDALRCCADRIQCRSRDTRGAGDRQ